MRGTRLTPVDRRSGHGLCDGHHPGAGRLQGRRAGGEPRRAPDLECRRRAVACGGRDGVSVCRRFHSLQVTGAETPWLAARADGRRGMEAEGPTAVFTSFFEIDAPRELRGVFSARGAAPWGKRRCVRSVFTTKALAMNFSLRTPAARPPKVRRACTVTFAVPAAEVPCNRDLITRFLPPPAACGTRA